MSKFDKKNFLRIIKEIELMWYNDENIWVPIGILEFMYDDNAGWIDKYFEGFCKGYQPYTKEELWNKISLEKF